jgi:hypothetical protein
VLAADLGGAFLAGGCLPAALELELPGVVPFRTGQSLLLDEDVTLHSISREVDSRECPVEWVHSSEGCPQCGERGDVGDGDMLEKQLAVDAEALPYDARLRRSKKI